MKHSTAIKRTRIRSKALDVLVASVLFAFALSGCSVARGKGERKAEAASAVPVAVMPVVTQDVPLISDFAAQTYARNTVEVRARVEGYIERWLFKPGSEVKAGQVLYVLDLRPYQASVVQAKGNLRQSEADLEFARRQVSLLQAEANLAATRAAQVRAQQDYERLKPLVQADAASQQDLDAAVANLRAGEANVKAAQASVDQARLSTRTQIEASEGKVESLRGALRTSELNLHYGTVRAPISGRIGDSLVPVGGLVTPSSSQPLTTIVPLDPIWVRFKVTEAEYLSWNKRGERTLGAKIPVTLILADNSEFPQKGHIENTLNQVDPRTGTLELQASFPNPNRTLRPGQFGRVRVQVDERRNALLVPQKAVQQLQNIQTVYTVGPDNKVLARGVTTGARVGEMWVIEQGLKPGDRVVVEGLLRVRPGVVVNPMPYKPGESQPGAANPQG
jgi:membrane fusion protein (multidrug efflux system)